MTTPDTTALRDQMEAHGADAEPARATPTSHSLCATSSCALREALEMLPALWRSRETGDQTDFDAGYEQASGECADVLEQALALSPAPATDNLRLRAENERLMYVLEGVAGAIDTGRNEPLQIWRDQIRIAVAALNDIRKNIKE